MSIKNKDIFKPTRKQQSVQRVNEDGKKSTIIKPITRGKPSRERVIFDGTQNVGRLSKEEKKELDMATKHDNQHKKVARTPLSRTKNPYVETKCQKCRHVFFILKSELQERKMTKDNFSCEKCSQRYSTRSVGDEE